MPDERRQQNPKGSQADPLPGDDNPGAGGTGPADGGQGPAKGGEGSERGENPGGRVVREGKDVMGMTESDLMNELKKEQEGLGPATKMEWMDKMDEVEVLIHLIAFVYHYDVATEHNDPANFDDAKWGVVREAALGFCNARLGEIIIDKLLHDFYRNRARKPIPSLPGFSRGSVKSKLFKRLVRAKN